MLPTFPLSRARDDWSRPTPARNTKPPRNEPTVRTVRIHQMALVRLLPYRR
jgi:hypothetical protein